MVDDLATSIWTLFRNRSLRQKVILPFLAVTLLSIGGLTYINNRHMETQLAQQAGKNLENVAVSQATSIGTTLMRIVGALRAFSLGQQVQSSIGRQNRFMDAEFGDDQEATIAYLREMDAQWVESYRQNRDDFLMQSYMNNTLADDLRELNFTFPQFSELEVTARHGGLVAVSELTPDYYQGDELWWRTAYNDGQGQIYIGQPVPVHGSRYPIIKVGIPIYSQRDGSADEPRELIGILGVTLDTTPIVNQLRAAGAGETGTAELLLGETDYLFGPHNAGVYDVHRDYSERDAAAFATMKEASAGHTRMELYGEQRFVAYAPISGLASHPFIDDLNWLVIVHQDAEEPLAVVRQTMRTTGVLAALIACLVVGVGVIMSQQVAGPIVDLSRAMTRFTEGDLDTRVDIDTGDETGILATRFNEMGDQVSALLQKLENRREQLEQRTQQLDTNQRAINVIFEASKQSSPIELLELVVNMIRDRFDLYHVQIYMVPEEEETAVLRMSTGYAGRQLLRQNHRIPLSKRSLVSRAIKANEPVLVRDVRKSSDFLTNPLLPETKAELIVPLRLEEKVIGALDAQARTADRFNQDVMTLFQTMAEQIAFLFQNSALLERVSEQNEALSKFTVQLRAAAELGQRLTTLHEPDEVLFETVEVIKTRFGYYHVHVYLLDDDVLVVRAGSGEVGRVLRDREHTVTLNAGRSLVARAARTKRLALANDVSETEDFLPNPLLPKTRSEVAVPLIVHDEVLGVLDVQDDQIARFSQPDLDTLNTLAGQVATALHNAYLFEEIQQTAERLREVDRLKSEFLANMSHELRTPLNSIIGYAEVMLAGIDGDLSEEILADVRAIHENGRHLLTLINDILDLAKIEAGGITLKMEDVDVRSLLEQVRVNHLGVLQQKKKDLDLVVEVDDDLPSIYADYSRLNQILDNLVSNAVKFTSEGSIALRAYVENDRIHIEVEDTGTGISAADQRHIFERFRQVDGSSTRVVEGTGLGLAITHQLVSMHGGMLEVDSELDVGSTFTVRLPIEPVMEDGPVTQDVTTNWTIGQQT